MNLKNLLVRTLSGAAFVAVMLGATLWSVWSLAAVSLLIVAGGMAEFYALAARCGARPQRVLGISAGVALLAAGYAGVAALWPRFEAAGVMLLGGWGLLFLIMAMPLAMVCQLGRGGENPVADVGATLLGVIYVALPMALLPYVALLVAQEWNSWIIVALLVIIWANDVFAYLVGVSFGRHRLCERISPKKSWEGFFGGVAGAVVAGAVAARLLGFSVGAGCAAAVVAAVAGVCGDLVESLFKRAAGVKDSGALIPGHGGLLDRFDALLIAVPPLFLAALLGFLAGGIEL